MLLYEIYREGKHSTFTHDGVKYSVDRLIRLTKDTETETVDISKLKWIIPVSSLEQKRVAKADLKYPIIVIKWHDKIVTLDGAHRVAKAVKQGKEKMQVKFATKSILDKCRL